MLDLASSLKRFRKEYKITQKQISEIAEISERNYQDYEYSKVVPSSTVLIKIANHFDVSIDYLVGRTDNPSSHKS